MSPTGPIRLREEWDGGLVHMYLSDIGRGLSRQDVSLPCSLLTEGWPGGKEDAQGEHLVKVAL